MNSPLSEVCACGGSEWHVLIGFVMWCRRCGAIRILRERVWRIPLDHAGEVADTMLRKADSEPPTDPGTPVAKKAGAD